MEPIQNEVSLDRAARGLFALVFLTLGIAKSRSLAGKLFIGLGILLGVTAATGTCPAYQATGVDTRETCTLDKLKQRLGR